MRLILTLLISLMLTLIFELLLAIIVKVGKRDLLLVMLVNIITNPAVVLIYVLISNHYHDVPGMLIQLPLEAAAVLVEWLYYRRFSEKIKKPFLFSLAANALSYSAGIIIGVIF